MTTINEEHLVPERLQITHQNLIKLGKRNAWNGFLPSLVVVVLHADRILVLRFEAKFSKKLMVILHKLWMSRY